MKLIVENVVGGGGTELVLDAWPSDSFAAIKEAVCQSLMIDPMMTMLVYNGKPLDDSLTPTHAALAEGSKLQLMLRTPGGRFAK
jgi:hypothetical protein